MAVAVQVMAILNLILGVVNIVLSLLPGASHPALSFIVGVVALVAFSAHVYHGNRIMLRGRE